MTIESTTGDLLKADVDALVNTVNTVGVMGKGLALQFKKTFPDVFSTYSIACKKGEVSTGKMHIVTRTSSPKYIVNFPTKQHWRNPSKLEYIEYGLDDLVKQTQVLGISSIAIPPLGCGYGGLSWSDVRPLIVQAFSAYPNLRILLFE